MGAGIDPQLTGAPCFASWSGGKDSCLALYRAVRQGFRPAVLLTMFVEQGDRTRSHGLDRRVMDAQAAALGLPLLVRQAAWDEYEGVFLHALHELRAQGLGHGIFGDIDIDPHRQWVERVSAAAGIEPHLPLWQNSRRLLLEEFLAAGFKATIIAIQDSRLERSFLGRELSPSVIEDLEHAGVDACGEEGEYHTVVTDGPLFSAPLSLRPGAIMGQEGYSFLDMHVNPSNESHQGDCRNA